MSHLSLMIGVLATVAQTLAAPAAARLPTVQPALILRVETAEHIAPRIVCGMVVVPVDAAVDRRMVVQPPSDVTFAIKVIVPPVCVD